MCIDPTTSLSVAFESGEVLMYAKKKQRNAPNVSLYFLLAALFGRTNEGWGVFETPSSHMRERK